MWSRKTFKTRKAMLNWIRRYDQSTEWYEVFTENCYCIEFRKLRCLG